MLAYQPSAYLIDLDDTLYEEKQFVLSGYGVVSEHIAGRSAFSAPEIYDYLHYVVLKFGRSGAFDRLLSAFDLGSVRVTELVDIYRNHSPKISFYPGVGDVLGELRKIAPLAVVTDGAAAMQRQKVAALSLAKFVDVVVLCDDLNAPKPDVTAFEFGAQQLGTAIDECAIIGDDPMHDIAAAKSLGIQAIRVKTGRFAELPTPDASPQVVEVDRFRDLSRICFPGKEWI